MADNISIKSHEFIGVDKVCPYETELIVQGPRRAVGGQVKNTRRHLSDPLEQKITHEVRMCANSITKAKEYVVDANVKIALVIWFSSASAIGRPSHSKSLVFEDEVYYFLTWTDILGKGHGRENDPRRIRDKKLINYLQMVENERHKQLIFDQITERQLI